MINKKSKLIYLFLGYHRGIRDAKSVIKSIKIESKQMSNNKLLALEFGGALNVDLTTAGIMDDKIQAKKIFQQMVNKYNINVIQKILKGIYRGPHNFFTKMLNFGVKYNFKLFWEEPNFDLTWKMYVEIEDENIPKETNNLIKSSVKTHKKLIKKIR